MAASTSDIIAKAGELITDGDRESLPPNAERLTTIANEYGIEML